VSLVAPLHAPRASLRTLGDMEIGDVLGIAFFVLLVFGPSILVLLSFKRQITVRVTWALIALLPVPIALGVLVFVLSVVKPAAGVHSGWNSVVLLMAIVGPWLVLWVFRRNGRTRVT